VQQRVDKLKAPILCLVSAPGVGKTSLGQSIARATNHKFVRMSLGGVRDEAEIRGHRRTYIGSMPGKIHQNMTKIRVGIRCSCSTKSTRWAWIFAASVLGAAGSARPGANNTFVDHYVEVEFDLSDVMFVTTATLNIPAPLLSRMEVFVFRGTPRMKVAIAKRIWFEADEEQRAQDQRAAHRRRRYDIPRYYTREAGYGRSNATCPRSAARWSGAAAQGERGQDRAERSSQRQISTNISVAPLHLWHY
jgi:ATP-dependent Lon protease